MANFKIKTVLPGFKRLFGMTAEVYNENNEILQSIDLNNSLKRFTFKFNKNLAFPIQRSASTKANLTIKLIDNNGDNFNFSKNNSTQFDLDADEQSFPFAIQYGKKSARTKLKPTKKIIDTTVGNLDPTTPAPENPNTLAPVFTSSRTGYIDENVAPGTLVYEAKATDTSAISFALKDGDSSNFTIDANTGKVTVNKSPDFETKTFYYFNVVATDAQGRATTQDIVININDIQEGKKTFLTPLFDNITAAFELTNVDDVITAELGTLNNADTIVDGFTTDNDKLTIKTNGTNSLIDALDASIITGIQNIETIQVAANNDRGAGDRKSVV